MKKRRGIIALGAVSTLLSSLVVVIVLSLSHGNNEAQDTAKTAQRGVDANEGAAARARELAVTAKTSTDKVSRKVDRQVIKLDRTITVLGKAGVRGLPGRTGSVGPPGITGATGPQGPPGKPPTIADIAAALNAFCQGGVCAGPAGRDGRDGTDAPAPTQDQVNAAVAVYCDAHNACASTTPGPAGPPGEASTVPGPAGPPGQDGVTTTVLVVCTGPGVPVAACP